MTPTLAQFDWQFALASVVAALAAIWLGRFLWRTLIPRRSKKVRATLTIGGKPVESRKAR